MTRPKILFNPMNTPKAKNTAWNPFMGFGSNPMNTPKTQPKTASAQPKYHDRITPEGHADEIPASATPAHTALGIDCHPTWGNDGQDEARGRAFAEGLKYGEKERDEAKLELAGTKANLALTEAQRDDWQEKHASALVELMTRTSERDEALAKLAQRDKDYSGCFEIREQYKLQRDELEKAHKDEREQKQRWFTAYKKASAAHDAVAQRCDELLAALKVSAEAMTHASSLSNSVQNYLRVTIKNTWHTIANAERERI